MEQSFENENACDIFMNEIMIENEPLQEPEKMQMFQTNVGWVPA